MRDFKVCVGGVKLFCVMVACVTAAATAYAQGAQTELQSLTVYSYRKLERIAPLARVFELRTGVRVNVVYHKSDLLERLVAEGAQSPADVLIANDFGILADAKDQGLTLPYSSPAIEKNVPAKYRDPEGHWFGLTRRIRAIFVSRMRVATPHLNYEDLADPKWRGRICIRSGTHPYNVALVASMIAHNGEEAARRWLIGLRANLARTPTGNDRAQMKAIHEGVCDVAIVNTYYMGESTTNLKQPEQRAWARDSRIIMPNAKGRGGHASVSAIALLKTSKKLALAKQFIAFMALPQSQIINATINYEYPLRDTMDASPLVMSWGRPVSDALALSRVAELRDRARALILRVGFNEPMTRKLSKRAAVE